MNRRRAVLMLSTLMVVGAACAEATPPAAAPVSPPPVPAAISARLGTGTASERAATVKHAVDLTAWDAKSPQT
jgi:hypothetical protein